MTRVTLVSGERRALAVLDLRSADVRQAFQNKFRGRRPAEVFTEDGAPAGDARLLGTPAEITLYAGRPDAPCPPRAPTAVVRRIFERSVVEPEALRQLDVTAALPGVRTVVGLPDLHPGNQYPVGCVVAADGVVYADLVGNDIGCGMALFECPFRATADSLYRRFQGWAPEGGPDGLGTIGGGNHFAEVVDCESGRWEGRRLLLVHSGSRAVGAAVARPDGGVDPASPEGRAYLAAHDYAVSWARRNRRAIARAVLGEDAQPLLDICHNSVTWERGLWLHRKGAAPGNQGPVVIPGSRGALSYVVEQRGCGAHNLDSLAHGAGRCLSRARARAKAEKHAGADLTRTALGSRVWTACQQHLAEEAPEAYKAIADVIDDLGPYCSVVAVLRPVLTLKA